MTFFHALAGVISLLLVVSLGYVLAKMNWFAPQCRALLPKLITNVALPPFLACTIISSFQRDSLTHMLYGTMLPALCMVILFGMAFVAGKLIKVEKKHFGLFCACVSNPNTIFIGIPVNMALFGPEALPYVLLYYFASTLFFWTVGNYFIARDLGASPAQNQTATWQKIISPPLLGFFAGIIIIYSEITLPGFLMDAARITGEMTTPLALIFIGITLAGMDLGKIHFGKDIMAALAGRMIISPLLMAGLLPFFGLPVLMGKVFVIQSSLPVLMQVAILSAYYNTDPDYGSIMVSLSTLTCAITIPVYMVLLG